MKYIKLFENYIDIDTLLVDINDKTNKYIVNTENFNNIDVEIVKKTITSENRRRDIVAYFKKGKEPDIKSNNRGYIYDYMYKSKDTIEVMDDFVELCQKIVNFTEHDFCFFRLSGMKLRISLGRVKFRNRLSNYLDYTDDEIKRDWGL